MSRLASAVLVAVLAGCASSGQPTPVPEAEPLEGSWELVAGTVDASEMALLETHPITLTFRGAEISGTAACNLYGATISVVGGQTRVSEIGQTAMACESDAMALEAQFTASLRQATAFERRGERLIVTGDGVELEFAVLPPPPTAEMVDTVWVLESVVSGDVAAAPMGEPASLELRSNGTFGGSTGCRSFEGRWIEDGARISAPEFGMDGRECPPELNAQDSHVVSVIGDGFTAVVDANRMTISDPTGEALVYRAEE